MSIIVTGGAGFIGSNLVEELVKQQEQVTILDNLSTGSTNNLKAVREKVKIIHASCQKMSHLKLPPARIIFHLGIPSSSPMYQDNPLLVGEAINGFINVFEFAKRNRSKVIYASTSSVYRGLPTPHREDMATRPFDYYTEARLAMERLARVYYNLHGVRSVGLRFFSVYGPHEEAKGRYANVVSQFLWTMRENRRPVIYGTGEQTRDFVHVKDVVEACIKAAKAGLECEVINVGTGKEASFNHVVELLNRVLRKSIKPRYCPNPIKNYVERTLADLSKAKELLGYKPSITLEEGIKQLVKGR